MPVIHAATALTPEGWEADVRLTIVDPGGETCRGQLEVYNVDWDERALKGRLLTIAAGNTHLFGITQGEAVSAPPAPQEAGV